jgi:hypothetical protein
VVEQKRKTPVRTVESASVPLRPMRDAEDGDYEGVAVGEICRAVSKLGLVRHHALYYMRRAERTSAPRVC